jgi:hypothetical protein
VHIGYRALPSYSWARQSLLGLGYQHHQRHSGGQGIPEQRMHFKRSSSIPGGQLQELFKMEEGQNAL